jgi:hypothetical protein
MRELGVTGLDAWEGQEVFARNAYWWWAFKGFAVLSERPTAIVRDPQGRLHNPSGAAVAFRDGSAVHAWHGTRVPADLIETGWDTQRILKEPNAEIRRCAIERMGWPAFITDARLKQVGATVDDPGNPGQTLALYDVPERIYDAPIRVLICINATVERDGTRHTFGLTVPEHIATPLAAAAWTFDIPESEYVALDAAC